MMILLANVVIMQNLFQQNRTYKYSALDFNVSLESSIMADEERWLLDFWGGGSINAGHKAKETHEPLLAESARVAATV